MSLSAALIPVSTSIAKGALKLWLKDSPLQEAGASSVIDIFAKKTSDLRAQRAGARQIERIADLISENLETLLSAEFQDVPENGRLAVFDAFQMILDAADLSALDICQRDLDPGAILQLLVAKGGTYTTYFGQSERELLKRLLSEASEYIIDIARQFPSFTNAALGEILRRETTLLEKAEQVILEVRRIGSRMADPASAASRFEAEYLRSVGRTLDHLELFGVDVVSSSRRYNLSIAYVSLSMEESQPELATEVELEISEALTPEDVLGQHTRILIQGPAGSGKTTFLQWVAVRCASRTMPASVASFNEKIPFFVALRKFSASGTFPAPEEFPRQVSAIIAAGMPDQWAHDVLRQGRGILLVDGLDELSESLRTRALAWLNEVLAVFPATTVILSTRPHATEKLDLSKLDFSDFTIQSMSFDDIEQFIQHWHRAVAENVQDDAERVALAELENRLVSSLQDRYALFRLATSPLVCAMLCALNRERINNIPRDRIELYRICVEMLLRRDVERQISLREYADLSDRHKLALLEDLAYWMLKNGQSEIDNQRAAERFDFKMDMMFPSRRRPSGEDVRRLFVERSGILRQPANGVVDFPHRSFQEYLAAQEALAQKEIPFLAANGHDAHWREVAVVAAGRARQDEADSLISNILRRAQRETNRSGALVLLAASCIEVAVGKSRELALKVEAELAKVIPPKTFSEAAQLALAGDLVLPYLKPSRVQGAQSQAASVRTLSLIKGPKVVDLLTAYAADQRQSVYRELIKCANRFSPAERYGEIVLSKITLESISLHHATNLDNLAYLPNLKSLDIGRSRLRELPSPTALRRLESLTLQTIVSPIDLFPLQHLGDLTSLSLYIDCAEDDGSLPDLRPLQNIPNLQHLYLHCSSCTDFLAVSSYLKRFNSHRSLSQLIIHLGNLANDDVDICALDASTWRKRPSRLTISLQLLDWEEGNLSKILDNPWVNDLEIVTNLSSEAFEGLVKRSKFLWDIYSHGRGPNQYHLSRT